MRTLLIVAGSVIVVIALAIGGAVYAFNSRIKTVELRPLAATQQTSAKKDTVYLFVGADSGIDRAVTDAQYSADGSARADVIVMVRVDAAGTATALSIPRDLLTDYTPYPTRLALTYLDGPDGLTEAVCGTLGVAVDRFVSIDTKSFVQAVDQLGGVEVKLPHPIRDTFYGLELPAGTQTLDGEQAFTLVRSRFGEQMIDGQWVGDGEVGGARDRAKWGGLVLKALKDKLSAADPATIAQGAWKVTDKLTLGGGTTVDDLQKLLKSDTSNAGVLPAKKLPGGGIAVEKTEKTMEKLRVAGFDTSCKLPGQDELQMVDGQVFEPAE